MKQSLHCLLVLGLLSAAACTKPGEHLSPDASQAQEGVVTGRVVDSQGNPVANAEIVASSTDYYNKTTTGYTDANGYYRLQLPTGIAEGSYTVDGSVTLRYHNKNFRMALYRENTRVFSAYEGAVRNFVFRLTGKRNVDDDADASPLGGTLQVHYQVDNIVRENLEITLEPTGPLVDGSTGRKIVATLPEDSYYIHDIPVGEYTITARDRVTGEKLGVTSHGTFKDYAPSVVSLFDDEDFIGSTHYEIILLVNQL